MKFKVNDKVKVVDYIERFNGMTGEVFEVHIELENEPVYMIIYDGSNNKGMFPESALELITIK